MLVLVLLSVVIVVFGMLDAGPVAEVAVVFVVPAVGMFVVVVSGIFVVVMPEAGEL